MIGPIRYRTPPPFCCRRGSRAEESDWLTVGGLLGFPWLFWSLYRLQDLDWPRRLIVLPLIPVAGEILWFLLLITRSRGKPAAPADSSKAAASS